MRRTPASFLLVALAAISIGCARSDQGGNATTNANAPGTTTYGNSTAPITNTTSPSESTTGGAVPKAAPPKASPTPPGIKPPTE